MPKPRMPSREAGPWIISILALVLAMGGTGLAAKKYLITSTNQIAPTVLKKLHGARGASGPAGPAGANGAPGANGANGAAGTAKGYATITFTGSVPSFTVNVGFTGVRMPQTGTLCIGAPSGSNPDGPLLASPSQGVGFVIQVARSICNPGEFQVALVNITNTAPALLPINIIAP